MSTEKPVQKSEDKFYSLKEVSYRDGGATLTRLQKELPTASAERAKEIEELLKLYKKDVWIILYGKIYDVSKFLLDHPGGAESLLNCAGKDATVDFDDIYHSPSAREQVADMYVGKIEGFNLDEDAIFKRSTGAESTGGISVTLLPVVVFVALIAYFLYSNGYF